MIGVAFEIHDSVEVERRRATADGALEDDDVLFLEHKYIRPGPADIFHYAFSHAGLLTGGSRSNRQVFDDAFRLTDSSVAPAQVHITSIARSKISTTRNTAATPTVS